jgi:hypothetical protein
VSIGAGLPSWAELLSRLAKRCMTGDDLNGLANLPFIDQGERLCVCFVCVVCGYFVCFCAVVLFVSFLLFVVICCLFSLSARPCESMGFVLFCFDCVL